MIYWLQILSEIRLSHVNSGLFIDKIAARIRIFNSQSVSLLMITEKVQIADISIPKLKKVTTAFITSQFIRRARCVLFLILKSRVRTAERQRRSRFYVDKKLYNISHIRLRYKICTRDERKYKTISSAETFLHDRRRKKYAIT